MKFTPFPAPSTENGVQLINTVGHHYVCNGCGEPVPDGCWLFENINDGMVIGLTARAGAADAPIVHECGEN